MSLFVQIVNNEVKQVWDTQPPAGESGWKSAVEVKPDVVENRQVLDGHTFDLTTDPVQIVYAVRDITVDERKGGLISAAKGTYSQVANEQARLEAEDASGDTAAVSTAKDVKDASIAAINACTTHDELDALA
tara:strand:- start:61 stop:456 length:396 start_codon:yes stop_codon:yes gene_type:complete